MVGLAALVFLDGGPNAWLIFLFGAAGAFVGDNIAYALERTLRIDRYRWMRGPRTQRGYVWAGRELEKRAVSLVLIARFIPVGRVVEPTAGATGYPRRMFVALTGMSALLWAAYSVAIGALAAPGSRKTTCSPL